MKSEYLILNILILSGPLLLSFDKKVRFVQYWSKLFPAIMIALIPFVIWDSLITGRHWWFNTNYTLPFRLLGLPIGEWLFFITVPYACVFSWEVIWAYFKNREVRWLNGFPKFVAVIGISSGVIFLLIGKEYTALVMFAAGMVMILELLLGTGIFRQRHTYIFSLALTVMMLLFNGYLTGRPVLIYDPVYQLDFRIFTIPIEDFVYGYALIFLVLIIFEKLKRRKNG